MRRVLVIAYYFPPMGLSGVQRVAKFVKYLPAYGWQPVVLTVDPAGYFAYDHSLMDEIEQAGIDVVRTPSLDPTRLFGRQKTVELPPEERRRWFSAISQFLFVPDNKIGWLPFALRRGSGLLAAQHFDAIFSSAPPYTSHVIAALLSKKHDLPLVLDFRDDWVGNPRHVYPTPLHRRIHQSLERWVMRQSRHAFAINEPIRQGLIRRNADAGEEAATVLPQGFDPDDFMQRPEKREHGPMQFVYTGVFYDAQTPDFFLRALAELVRERPALRNDVEAVFVGLLPEGARRLVDALGLADRVRYLGYVDHACAVAHQLAADVLWMTIGRRPGADGISTGKLFEYFGARKPILALVPEGAVCDVLAGHGAAHIVPPDDVAAIKEGLWACFQQWQAGALPVPNESFIQQFDRHVMTGALADVLERSAGVA